MTYTYTLPDGLYYKPYLIDMIEGNHTLIAGTTGAGKSVLENNIIWALLCTKFPGTVPSGQGCKLVLIDPKKVELQMYRKLPHTWLYADTIDTITAALYNVRHLIDCRLNDMKRRGLRKSSECPVYVFIDELVDLMTSPAKREIVRLLSDSASISRACNVFFVVLTQSPARVIIPAQFKLLFNCRVGLRCNNAIESRQIIDDDSAVYLPKHGLAIVQQDIERYQIEIPLLDDYDILNLVKFWEKQHPIHNYFKRAKCRF